MLSPELTEQIYRLSTIDRLALLDLIVESLRENPTARSDRSRSIANLRGLLKTDRPTPSDEDVERMLEQRRAEKYLP